MSAASVSSSTGFHLGAYAKPALAAFISALIIFVIGAIPDLGIHAKVAFITFGLAIVGWTLTAINDTYIALAAAIVFSATGIDEPSEFFETLGDPLIWLMFASFIIAAAVKVSGLSERMALFVTRHASSVRQLFIMLTIVLIGTAFLVPSTSGRAALMLPVFLAIRAVMPNDRVAKALSLLFPAVILLSAIASLIGAGAHLITADILLRTGGEYLGFGRWLLMGLPFAIASSFAAMFAILFMFTTRHDRAERLNFAGDALAPRKAWSRSELIVAGVTSALVILWATETAHGVNSTLVAIIGGLILTAPMLNVVSFKSALKEVDWGMLIFMAATLELGEALIESGGAQWLVDNLFSVFQGGIADSPLLSVAMVATFGLLSHLVITSRSSRASVIIPLVIFLATALGFSPTTFAFMTAAATGFCLTLPVSAKPVAMFAKVDGPTYAPRDLLRLSSALLPIHLVLLVVFAFFIWPSLGLEIAQAKPTEAPDAPIWNSQVTTSSELVPFASIINLGPNPYREGKQVDPNQPMTVPPIGTSENEIRPLDTSRDADAERRESLPITQSTETSSDLTDTDTDDEVDNEVDSATEVEASDQDGNEGEDASTSTGASAGAAPPISAPPAQQPVQPPVPTAAPPPTQPPAPPQEDTDEGDEDGDEEGEADD
ncbi:MAG: anion permease [Anaerolineae bacterium]|nr:anion permease [Anaerolineae bacterium]